MLVSGLFLVPNPKNVRGYNPLIQYQPSFGGLEPCHKIFNQDQSTNTQIIARKPSVYGQHQR